MKRFYMRLGPHEKKMLEFFTRIKGYHSLANDRQTHRAALSLERKGLLSITKWSPTRNWQAIAN